MTRPAESGSWAPSPLTPRQADLAITKTVSNPRPIVGMPVVYTFVIRNNGPSTATNVIVRDPFRPGLLVVDAAVFRRMSRRQREWLRWPRTMLRLVNIT